jgi:histidinol dehydrogenase
MRIIDYNALSQPGVNALCDRNPVSDPEILEVCQKIFDKVRTEGDAAIRDFTLQFDGIEINNLRVSRQDINEASTYLSAGDLEALKHAAANIGRFHQAQYRHEPQVQVEKGITCWREGRAIENVGLYIPAGTAPLPSTVLMLAIPARLAGCKRVVLCSPPQENGSVDPAILSAAQVAGVQEIYAAGGAQAVAALTFGTESVPRVHKIFGPGNRYVQTAKFLATSHGLSIDAIAGPSEVLVIADEEAEPGLIASDLLSQAEHDPDSQALLVTTSGALVESVVEAVKRQLAKLQRRKIAQQALAQSFLLKVPSLELAFQFSNQFAPEHLILHLRDAANWTKAVSAAGSVFVGAWAPEVAGDYASGTNHVLPTSGTAASTSGVSLDSFSTRISFQELTCEGFRKLSPTLETLAELEELQGHREAVRVRLAYKPEPDTRPTFRLEELVRPNILSLKPYRSARGSLQDGLLLDANENPFDIDKDGVSLNRYPDPNQILLREGLAKEFGLSASQILCGVGSDEIIDWILKLFCQPGQDALAIATPSYGMYKVVADTQGVETIEFPLNSDFNFESQSFLSSVPGHVKLLILCSPNNPTGNLLDRTHILNVLMDWNGFVVVDEAYMDFSDEPSLASELAQHPNLGLLRTFSKAVGRAGIRLGFLLASEQLIEYASRIKMPYNLSSWVMRKGLDVLSDSQIRAEQTSMIKAERQRMVQILSDLSMIEHVYPSQTNFLLFQCSRATLIHQELLKEGIVIRDRSGVPGLSDCLRVTVGKPDENNLFLKRLQITAERLAYV